MTPAPWDDDAITLVTDLGRPCMSLAGCCNASVPGKSRCELHTDAALQKTATGATRASMTMQAVQGS